MPIDYSEAIPNNVNLAGDRRLQRALEQWRPGFLEWWREMGPIDSHDREVYLRTATSVDAQGWATFGYVKMPDYRWGIFLTEPEAERKIAFGAHRGDLAWQEVPGEYRAALRRLVVTQGDTEPASVEQQRHLGATCPSLYDLRNLYQVNVEEARHLWAMVYILHAHFGRDGREEAEALLRRRSGNSDNPRILGAFNERTPDWLSYLMFTYFTDRDGKYQLASLAESAFDPLARTCRFMLTEEAHHMFVGETGVGRVVRRTCELMREHHTDAVGQYGGIDLKLIQKYLNFHYSVSLDLFGSELSTNAANYFTMGLKGRFNEESRDDDHRLNSELSTNAANYFTMGLKGRFNEESRDDDHRLNEARYAIERPIDGKIERREESALLALNENLRDSYATDCARGVVRWNKIIQAAGIDFELTLPHRGFNRKIGDWSAVKVTPAGELANDAQWTAHADEWLPTAAEREFVGSLMRPVTAPGKFAGWIAPPARGIHHQPIEFEYVRP